MVSIRRKGGREGEREREREREREGGGGGGGGGGREEGKRERGRSNRRGGEEGEKCMLSVLVYQVYLYQMHEYVSNDCPFLVPSLHSRLEVDEETLAEVYQHL